MKLTIRNLKQVLAGQLHKCNIVRQDGGRYLLTTYKSFDHTYIQQLDSLFTLIHLVYVPNKKSDNIDSTISFYSVMSK